MPKLTFVDVNHRVVETETQVGHSVMEAARIANVEGITADCGGACSCATCHVHITPEWMARAGQPSELEADMLDGVPNLNQYSRLCCQIVLTEELDGLICSVPGD